MNTIPSLAIAQAQTNSAKPKSRVFVWLKRITLWLGIGIVATEMDKRAYPPPVQMVEVGGYRLHLYCTGAHVNGSPTVILGQGGGGNTLDWFLVQPEVAKATSVCSYDRAGQGWSDPAPEPRDGKSIAKDLHTLLQNAGIPGPYVLAGHSYGGLFVCAYLSYYPEEVVGLVLLDSAHPDESTRTPEGQAQYKSDSQVYGVARILARLGLFRFGPNPFKVTPSSLPGLSVQQTAEWNALVSAALFWDTTDAESRLIIETMTQVRAAIQEHIFTPLTMQRSFTSQAEAQDQGMATGYRQWFGFPIPAHLPDDRAARPSSFLISSAEDLTHLLIAELNGGRYSNGTVLSPQGIAETQRPITPIGGSDLRSGMGMDVGEVNGVYIAGKKGGTGNYNARIVLAPLDGWGVVVLANTFDIGLGEQFDTMANGIAAILVNAEPPRVLPAPPGGGNAVMKFILAAVAVFQIVTLFRMHSVLRSALRDWRWLARHIGVPLAPDMILTLLLLVAGPRSMNAPLSFLFYFAPDIFWLTIAVVIIPFSRDILKGLLTLRSLRATQSARLAYK